MAKMRSVHKRNELLYKNTEAMLSSISKADPQAYTEKKKLQFKVLTAEKTKSIDTRKKLQYCLSHGNKFLSIYLLVY